MIDYKPKSETQLTEEGLIPEGVYDFEIVDVSDKPSKTGKDMITLSLHVFATAGAPYSMRDWIVLGNNLGERKLRRAADACNILDKYESGKLTHEDFRGCTGKLYLKIQQSSDPDYPLPRNAVSDYVKRERQTPRVNPVEPIEEDSIPF